MSTPIFRTDVPPYGEFIVTRVATPAGVAYQITVVEAHNDGVTAYITLTPDQFIALHAALYSFDMNARIVTTRGD